MLKVSLRFSPLFVKKRLLTLLLGWAGYRADYFCQGLAQGPSPQFIWLCTCNWPSSLHLAMSKLVQLYSKPMPNSVLELWYLSLWHLSLLIHVNWYGLSNSVEKLKFAKNGYWCVQPRQRNFEVIIIRKGEGRGRLDVGWMNGPRVLARWWNNRSPPFCKGWAALATIMWGSINSRSLMNCTSTVTTFTSVGG